MPRAVTGGAEVQGVEKCSNMLYEILKEFIKLLQKNQQDCSSPALMSTPANRDVVKRNPLIFASENGS